MNGRQETDKKIEDLILRKIKRQDRIVKDYYYSLSDKTSGTKQQYLRHVTMFLDYINYFGDTSDFEEIKPSIIDRYMESIRYTKNGKEKSPATRAVVLHAITNFFDFLQKEGYIDDNVCKKVNMPRVTDEREVVAMTWDEVRKVEENIKNTAEEKWRNRDLCIFVLGCTTGLRRSSIREINIEDIDLDGRKLNVTEKGNKIRTVMLGDKTINLIKEWMKDRERILRDNYCDALFIHKSLERISLSKLNSMINKYTEVLDKHITPHKMRSTCATNLYEATGDIYLVQEVLGHKNIANTRRYAKVSEQKRMQAADILNALV